PDKVGLHNWKWRARRDCGTGGPPVSSLSQREEKEHGRAARATIPPAFSYIASRLGVESAETLQLGSPFDYTRQATLYIEADLPEPSDANRFVPAACERIVKY